MDIDLVKMTLMKPVIYPEPATIKAGRQSLGLVGRHFIQLTTSHSENFTDRVRAFADSRARPLEMTYGNVSDLEASAASPSCLIKVQIWHPL
jgi:hypothetical protein